LFWRGPVTVKRVRFDGTVLAEWTHWRLCADRLDSASLVIPADVATPTNPREELLVATMHDSTAYGYFAEDIDIDLPDPQADIAVDRDSNCWLVTVTTKTLIKDLCLFVDRIHPDATVDDMLVTLLPGESRVFRVTCVVDIDAEALGRRPVFRCANQLL
jgi:beta-mannosidase